MKSNAKPLLILGALALVMAGCSTPIITKVAGTGTGLTPPARLTIVAAEQDAPAIDAETQAMLSAALTRQGYVLSGEGDYIFDFSLAERPATMGVSLGQSGPSLSAAKAKKPLQSCKDRTHRLTVLIVDRKSGQAVYRGGAEEHHCRGSLSESRAALVDGVVADISKPADERLIPRKGRR